MTHPISIGTKVTVTVVKVLSTGLLVSLPQAGRGVIRQRELGWHGSPEEPWQDRFAKGQSLQALVISQGEPVELSLRFAERDPWQDVTKRLKRGMLVPGVVTGVAGYGAFVELEPGVTGLLHQSQLPEGIAANLYDLFWVGDRVQVEVIEVDPCDRKVALSMKAVGEQRWQPHRNRCTIPSDPTAGMATGSTTPSHARTRSVLLIEEDAVQCKAIEAWLRNAGHRVTSTLPGAESLALLQQEKPEVVLATFPTVEQTGAELLQYILAPQHPVKCILMTDWTNRVQHEQQFHRLTQQGVTLLNKPVLPQELLETLAASGTGRRSDAVFPMHSVYSVQRFREQSLIISRAAPFDPSGTAQNGSTQERTSTQTAIQTSLLNLRRQTGASTVVLFGLDPQQRQVHVVAHKGKETPQNIALSDLIHSPVRDVAEDELTVQVGDADRAAAYVRYLRPLLHFQSCVGVPVPGNLSQRYALFLFSKQTELTGNALVRDAAATATVLGALLEQEAFLERAADMQSAIVLGHLARALVHETNHGLNPILFALSNLEHQCEQVAETVDCAPESLRAEMQTAQLALHQLGDHVQKLVSTTHLFSRLTVQDAPGMVRLDTLIEQCMALVRDTADRARVSLYFQPPTHLITTLLRESQMQQVLLNVLLNAIQNIALCRPDTGGSVHLRMEIDTPQASGTALSPSTAAGATPLPIDGPAKVIRIVVEDDGPGIHRCLWERIFALGFTTRQGEGSGLGLFLSQRLLQATGGAIYVQDSSICWGTCMAMELPIHVA